MVQALELSRATLLFLGWKIAPFPDHDESRVIKHYGHADGHILVANVCSILSDLMEIVPDWDGHDLGKATTRAIRQIARKYPALNGDVLAALAWTYSYNWK